MLLIGRQSVQAVPDQDAVHRWTRRRRLLVKALQIVGDLARAEVIVLPEVQDLADDFRRRGASATGAACWVDRQARRAVRVKPPLPPIERLPRNAKMPARAGDVPRHAPGLLQSP